MQFDLLQDYENHSVNHDVDYFQTDKSFTCITHCDICSAIFPSGSLLEQHKKQHRKTVNLFPCPRCPRSFFSRGSLDKHAVRCAQRKFPCHCNESFETEITWFLHIRNCFPGQATMVKILQDFGLKEHICDLCFKIFGWKLSLNDHKLHAHTKESPFKCDVCNDTL